MPLLADWITVPLALLALVVAFLAFLDSHRYRRTVTEAQLAVKCQPSEDHCLDVLVVNVGAGIAYDVTFTEGDADDVVRGFPGWRLDLGDLLPKEERVVMSLDIEKLKTMSSLMVALRYKTAKQYGYPTVRAQRSKYPEYQRTIDLHHWAYELKQHLDRQSA